MNTSCPITGQEFEVINKEYYQEITSLTVFSLRTSNGNYFVQVTDEVAAYLSSQGQFLRFAPIEEFYAARNTWGTDSEVWINLSQKVMEVIPDFEAEVSEFVESDELLPDTHTFIISVTTIKSGVGSNRFEYEVAESWHGYAGCPGLQVHDVPKVR